MQGTTNWNDLRYFLAVQRTGTLAAAARGLRVDQTTVGRRLQALEQALDARLFDQTDHGFALTAAGERMLDVAVRMEEQMADVALKVAGENRRAEGVVRLATSDTFAFGFLLPHIADLRRRHPAITLELVTASPAVNLSKREADLAIRLGAHRVQQANILTRKLADLPWSLYASKTYLRARGPVVLKDGLAGHDVIGFDEEMQHLPAAKWLAEASGAARQCIVVNGLISMCRAAAAGLGIAALPCFLGVQDARLSRALPGQITAAECWLLAHPDLARTARVRAVMDFVVETAANNRHQLEGQPTRSKAR